MGSRSTVLLALGVLGLVAWTGCSTSSSGSASSTPPPPEVRWSGDAIMIDPAPPGKYYEATMVFEKRTSQTVVIDNAVPALNRDAKIELRPETKSHTVAPRTSANQPYEELAEPVRYRMTPPMWDFVVDDNGSLTKITITLKNNQG